MAKVVGYVRISKEEKGNQSLLTQENAIRDWCRALGHDLVAVYRDEGVSGGVAPLDRAGASEAINHARQRGIGALVIAKLDRVSRDLADILNLVDNVLGKQATLISISESFDASTAGGRMFLQMLGSFSEFERNRIRQRTREALETRRRQGRKTGGDVPFGYRCENGFLKAEPTEQVVLDRALMLREEGFSWNKVATRLNSEGMRMRRREGRPWHRTTLYRLIRSELRRRADMSRA